MIGVQEDHWFGRSAAGGGGGKDGGPGHRVGAEVRPPLVSKITGHFRHTCV